ncbi:hypothetical protein HBI70_061900 [Parastagonospora nodorum]|nr:hypothetical protein HBH49_071000 [Parastagonospora nodorum]KAH4131175.1 hypothetical protein HBH47_019320 [Parastagonospora nodorum]KAH4175603.1 hypothetical protein HBH43_064600 [Parastagonospora nodorum]KAH4195105.1 hypothetical protein HBH42_089020 [Parastagonospora nodorum]KAH4813629.1 hypothetical protein HBH61_078540 [Parastagonospora nodorum]
MLKSVVGAGYFTEVRTSLSITILIINSLRNTACSIACSIRGHAPRRGLVGFAAITMPGILTHTTQKPAAEDSSALS